MKNWLAGVMLLSVGFALGCTRSNRPNDQSSETHFLALCSDNGCGPGLRCVCGVCSAACELGDDAMCGAFAENAICGETADGCSASATCDVTCENDADCEALGPIHACSAGRCRAEAEAETEAEAEAAPAAPRDAETRGFTSSDILGQPNIAARCKVDRDCDRELTCRTDFLGERGLCTRSCNDGCPSLTTCADAVPGYNGGAIRDVCMRPCETNADCPLDTSCAAPSDGPRYCY